LRDLRVEMESKWGGTREELNYRVEVRVKGEKGRESRRDKGLKGRKARYELNYKKTTCSKELKLLYKY
jgi:hypothetical protein